MARPTIRTLRAGEAVACRWCGKEHVGSAEKRVKVKVDELGVEFCAGTYCLEEAGEAAAADDGALGEIEADLGQALYG